jgi:hypothetical protein
MVEDQAKDLLKMFGPFLGVSGVGDVKDAMRLRPRKAFDHAGVCLLHGGGEASAWCAIFGGWNISSCHRRPRLVFPSRGGLADDAAPTGRIGYLDVRHFVLLIN